MAAGCSYIPLIERFFVFKNIAEVVVGDVIIEGGNRTTVTKVDTTACMHKVHINDKYCYEGFTEVRVQD